MKTVLLLGGTGAIGVYLKDVLVRLGFRVVVTSRAKHMDEVGVEYVLGDAKDDFFVSGLLARLKPDAIVDFMIYSTESFSRRFKMLLDGCSHYLFLSSYRVYADEMPLTEDSPRLLDVSKDESYLKTDDYGLSKARCENLLFNSGRKNWTILRPSITYSKRRFQFGCLEANSIWFRAKNELEIAIPRDMLGKKTTLTWGGDVAEMIGRLVLNDVSYGEVYNCATSDHLTWQDIANIYNRTIGLRVSAVGVEDYCRIIGRRWQVIYDRMFDRVVSNKKILSHTGLSKSEISSPEDGLVRELNRYNCVDVAKCIYVGMEARMDQVLGTRMPLRGLSLRDKILYFRILFNLVRKQDASFS